ncbi:MAG: CocE/NonD family hydrolase [Nitrospinota bacterium]
MYVNPDSIRTAYPSAWPQHPFNEPPKTPEQSLPKYSIYTEEGIRIPMRDGVNLAADVFRPYAPGEKFPALVAWSPYSRQLQQTLVPIGQNEAGITEFWTPRGYVHAVVDARGSNDSEGAWDFCGPIEQQDLAETIEWVASQPWCNGRVGMVGCSYYGRSQILVAGRHQPPSLKAVFPYDAATDMYRDSCFHGGIPSDGFLRGWFANMSYLNFWGGRLKDRSGFERHIQTALGQKYPLDCEYYQERSSWPRLDRIKAPAYFGCDWQFYHLHLRGAFSGWEGVHNVPKRMLVGPLPQPRRPFANYHLEALRWYDHWLKDMDTRVMEGPPIQLYVQGENTWRSESEWPLARAEWRELYLAGPAGGLEGTLSDAPGPEGGRTYEYDPLSSESRYGNPRLIYRTEPQAKAMEVTGPIVLYLRAQSSGEDTDWFVSFMDEDPQGGAKTLTKGWLRASHREIDESRSRPWQPWHPHTRQIPLTPNQAEEFAIEVIPTCNLFRPGHRLRIEIASCDSVADNFFWYHAALAIRAKNTILEGKGGSRLLVPVIPR